MIWLGPRRGHLTDWITQRWVCLTGRRVALEQEPWLSGPAAPTTGIEPGFFEQTATREGLSLIRPDAPTGILPNFQVLRGPSFNPDLVHPQIADFYERTSDYELDAWAAWCGVFRPFGWLLAVLFSRRLQQLNVPLSPLDTSRGLTNEVLQFVDPSTRSLRHTAWFRRLRASDRVLYAGFYSVCHLPRHPNPCIKVVFPLPNGNAIVLMKTENRPDGSFVVISSGRRLGDPGFCFTVQGPPGVAWARYVRSLRESIHIHPPEGGCLGADHLLTWFGFRFLQIHYRLRSTSPGPPPSCRPVTPGTERHRSSARNPR